MLEHIHSSLLASFIQAIGILLVASLLYPLTRAMQAKFLKNWAIGWVALAIGLLSLVGSFELKFRGYDAETPGKIITVVLLMVYCLGGYCFGTLLWRGCRAVANLDHLPRAERLILLIPISFGVMAPVGLGDINQIFPLHSLLMSMFYWLAFFSLGKVQFGPLMPQFGFRVVRLMVLLLALLFFHYAVVVGYFHLWLSEPCPKYISFASYYDALLQIGLAFGMIVLSSDKLRESLELKNLELSHAARTDRLTGLFNRRALDEILLSEEAPSQGCLAAIDMNDLKPLNDRYGHSAGDVAIQHVARALRLHFRVTDPLFRLGGDEFLVLISGWSVELLSERLNGVEQSLQNLRIPGVAEPITITVSWGVAGFHNQEAIRSAMEQADQQMYQYKRAKKLQRTSN
jgi:diguanylate cyclase (GGDEF)-like protein